MPSRSRRAAVALFVAASALAGPLVAPVAAAGTTIVVTSVGDPSPGNDGLCTLREAIVAGADTEREERRGRGGMRRGDWYRHDRVRFTNRTVTTSAVLPNIASSLTSTAAAR